MTNYKATTAQIIADNGETMKADIMETGESYTEKLFEMRDDLRGDYWKLHNEIAKHEFKTGTQTAALAKLGQLALALEAIEKAYSAANIVRCF